jgi:hypothetical protein
MKRVADADDVIDDSTTKKIKRELTPEEIEKEEEKKKEEAARVEENKLIWTYKDAFSSFAPKDLKVLLDDNGLSDRGGLFS